MVVVLSNSHLFESGEVSIIQEILINLEVFLLMRGYVLLESYKMIPLVLFYRD